MKLAVVRGRGTPKLRRGGGAGRRRSRPPARGEMPRPAHAPRGGRARAGARYGGGRFGRPCARRGDVPAAHPGARENHLRRRQLCRPQYRIHQSRRAEISRTSSCARRARWSAMASRSCGRRNRCSSITRASARSSSARAAAASRATARRTHIAGLTCLNEGTLRDWTRHGTFNVTQGKNFDRSRRDRPLDGDGRRVPRLRRSRASRPASMARCARTTRRRISCSPSPPSLPTFRAGPSSRRATSSPPARRSAPGRASSRRAGSSPATWSRSRCRASAPQQPCPRRSLLDTRATARALQMGHEGP